MKESLLEVLRCPRCSAERPFSLDAGERDEREIRSGRLTCASCGHVAAIEDGIVDLMHDPPEFVTRESAGLERFAEEMRNTGWDRERITNLPFEPLGYWFTQAAAMQKIVDEVPLTPGGKAVDIGSNTCWASNALAERGLDVIALDISTTLMQGLRTGDWWFEEKGTYFDRMLSVMFAPAIASNSLDYVFCAEVLHHNHRENLFRTMREFHRILKPGGKVLVSNEPLRFPTNLKFGIAKPVEHYEGHEHIYFAAEYLYAAKRAGFSLQLLEPNTTPFFRDEPFVLRFNASYREIFFRSAQQMLRSSKRGRKLYKNYKLFLGPEIYLPFVATKQA